MKKIIVLIFLFLSFDSVFAQKQAVLSAPVTGDFSAYPMILYTAKGPQIPLIYLLADYSIDNDENVYLGSFVNGKISKYNKNKILVNEILLPQKFFAIKGVRRFLLANDSSGCLYALLVGNDYFKGIIKYDKNGNEDKNFNLIFNRDAYIRRLYFDNEDNLCIWSMHANLNSLKKDGDIFVYSNTGTLLRKTENSFVTSQYRIRKIQEDGKFYIECFQKQNDTASKGIERIYLADVIKNETYSGLLIGCDKQDNVFCFNNSSIKRLNILTRQIGAIPLDFNDHTFGDCVADIRSIKVTQKGNLYIFGVRGKNFQIDGKVKYAQDQLEYVVEKLN
jgi:hypothetical protein